MCDNMALSAYILKIAERDPFLRLHMRAKEEFDRLRLLNGLVFIEVVLTQTAISAFRAMLINYVYFPYLFKSNTMQHVCPIINSLRQPNLEKSEYTVSLEL